MIADGVSRSSDRAMTLRRVLVANRGEIAVRIIRACREAGIESIAVYSDADAGALHTRLADRAVWIGPAVAADSYLSIPALLGAARDTGSDAVHPGYGFLAERAEFARACEAAGVIFIGPPADAINKMGSKIAARALMQAAGVPVVPGETPADQSDSRGCHDGLFPRGYCRLSGLVSVYQSLVPPAGSQCGARQISGF